MIRGLDHFSYEHRLRAGVLQSGEKKAPGVLYGSLPVPKARPTRKLERDF